MNQSQLYLPPDHKVRLHGGENTGLGARILLTKCLLSQYYWMGITINTSETKIPGFTEVKKKVLKELKGLEINPYTFIII